MSSLNNNCSCAGFDLIGLSSSIAIFISQNFDTDDLGILGAFFTTLGDNLSLVSASRSACENQQSSDNSRSLNCKTKQTICGSDRNFSNFQNFSYGFNENNFQI